MIKGSLIGKKRGLSPVIATVLLVSIALILALIIFLWARSFVSEKLQKFGEPIANACDTINFKAEVIGSSISIENLGNVPIYGIDIRKVSQGTVEGIPEFSSSTISNGQVAEFNIPSEAGISVGDDIVVVPIIVGENQNNKQTFKCDKSGYQTSVREA